MAPPEVLAQGQQSPSRHREALGRHCPVGGLPGLNRLRSVFDPGDRDAGVADLPPEVPTWLLVSLATL